MSNLNWIPLSEHTPEPGDYLTRRDLEIKEGRHGHRQIRAVILPAHWDGEKWNLHTPPHYYRPLPGGAK